MRVEADMVVIHTDGGCRPNPGAGGWAAVLEFKGKVRELSGAEPKTTNNRMELTAAVRALEALNRPCRVAFYTDSEYLKNGISKWMQEWKRNGWKTAAKKNVLNQDLWKALDDLVQRHEIEWHWVKGHAGHAMNERCDELATEAREAIERT